MKRLLLILVSLIVFMASGCNMLIKLPFGGPDIIPLETFAINETIPNDGTVTDVVLTLAPSNASVVIAGQADEITGEILYNVADWKPSLVLDDNILRIMQPMPENNIFETPKDAINAWELVLSEPLTNISVTVSSGTYDLTFLDTLPDATTIHIQSSVGNLRLVFPAGVAVNVDIQHGIGNVATEGVWSHQGDNYTTGDAENAWTVNVVMGVGNLTLVCE